MILARANRLNAETGERLLTKPVQEEWLRIKANKGFRKVPEMTLKKG